MRDRNQEAWPPVTEKTPKNPTESSKDQADKPGEAQPKEIGGRDGPEPTRFGDWEKGGRCVDF